MTPPKQMPIFFAAPHRVMFAAGCVQSVLAMLLWTYDLGGRYAGLWSTPVWPMAPLVVHATLMIYGVLSFFIFGFLFTAGPRWQGYGELRQAEFVPAFLLLATGWGVFYAGLFFGHGATLGLLLVLLGWLLAWQVLLRIARQPQRDRRHIVAETVAVGLGGLGLVCAAAAFGLGDYRFHPLLVAIGIWGYLLPAFFTVEHRMLPFFTNSALPGRSVDSPPWALWAIWGLSLAHGLFDYAGLVSWRGWADIPASAICFMLSVRWGLRRALHVPMVAVLHGGFVWAGVSFALFALQSLLLLADIRILGLAPLHVMTIGYFMSTLVGMASRVIRGHSGQSVVADRVMMFAWWSLQGVVLLRVAAECVALPGPLNPNFLAAAVWVLALGVWLVRYAPPCWRPRADGRPG